jgi:hypothetical protein
MDGSHWFILLVAIIVGYLLGRVWATPAQALGLP